MNTLHEMLRRHRWGMEAGLVVLFCLYTTLVQTWPRVRHSWHLWHRLQAQQERLERAVHWKDDWRRLVRERRMLEERYATTFASLPGYGERATALQTLQHFARQAGATLTKVRPGSRSLHETHSERTVQVRMRGRFRAIADFIHLVEGAPRLMNVDDLLLSAQITEGPMVEAKISIRVITMTGLPTLPHTKKTE